MGWQSGGENRESFDSLTGQGLLVAMTRNRFSVLTLFCVAVMALLAVYTAHAAENNAWSLRVDHLGVPNLTASDFAAAPPSHPRANLWQGLAALAQGNAADALSVLEVGALRYPSDPMLHLALGNAFEAQGQLDKAVSIWRAARAVVVLQELGNAFAQARKWPEAALVYRAVVDVSPTDCVYRTRTGSAIWQSTQDLAGAMDQFEQAVRLCPANLEGYVDASRVLIDAKSYAEANRWATLGLHVDPASEVPLVMLGLIHLRQNEPAQALPYLQEASSRNAANAEAHALLGSAYLDLRMTTEAVAELSRAIQLEPAQSWQYEALGSAYEQAGNRDSAIAAYLMALELDPENQNTEVRLHNLQATK